MTSTRHTEFASFVLDRVDFMDEKFREAVADEAARCFWGQLAKCVVHLSFEFENCEMDARAYRVPLHFSLHCHLLPYHHLLLHHHFLLNHGLAFLCENAGVETLRRLSFGLQYLNAD